MAIEWLALWGVGKVVGKLVEPVLEDLAKDLSKDQAKSLLHRAAKLIPQDEYLKAYGKAIKELVEVIDEELRNAGVVATQTEAWAKDIQQFIRTESLREVLPQSFTTSNGAIDGQTLQRGWQQLPESSPLPPDFDWDFVAKSVNRKLRRLREEDGDFRAILQAQAAVETAAGVQQLAGIAPEFDQEKYRAALLERYARLGFDTLDTTGANYSGVKLWSVFVPQTVRECHEYYPQLLEIPKDHLQRLITRGELDERDAALNQEIIETRRRAYVDQSPRSVLEVINDERIERLVVLGDPGAGKSSLLRYLALEWANTKDAMARYSQPLPLVIDLREYDRWECPNGKSFVRYLHDAQNWHRLNQRDLDRKLKTERGAVLLLDGLDEIFDPARREQAINDIHRFSNDYPQTRIIVTSRVIGYKPQRLTDAEFRHFMLQDLDDAQVSAFLDHWHIETFRDARDGAAKRERLAKALRESHAIRQLGGNPLLLTMMAILNRHQELPRDRAQLYAQASRVLLQEWDTEKLLDKHPQLKGLISYQEKTEMLREVAYFMQANEQGLAGNIIASADLERILRIYLQEKLGMDLPAALQAARALIEQLRERNFILCYLGGDSYAFVHRTFLEYFCALALMREFRQRLSLDYLKGEVFGRYWQDKNWEEVLCLIAAMVAESSNEQVVEIINFLLEQEDPSLERQHIFLAAYCFQEMKTPTAFSDTRNRIIFALKTLFDSNYQSPQSFSAFFKREATEAIAFSILANPLFLDDPSWLKENIHGSKYLRREKLQALTQWRAGDPNIALWLKEIVASDNSRVLVEAAIRELASKWKDDPDTLPWLKQRARQDESWVIRQVATQQLAAGWKDETETMSILKDLAIQDVSLRVRKMAVQEIARGWGSDPDIQTWLAQLPPG